MPLEDLLAPLAERAVCRSSPCVDELTCWKGRSEPAPEFSSYCEDSAAAIRRFSLAAAKVPVLLGPDKLELWLLFFSSAR